MSWNNPEDGVGKRRAERFAVIDAAFRKGDFESLGMALGGSPRWYDEPMPVELGLGHPLEYAIYWSPLAFVERLIAAGASVEYDDHGGFPALIAALSTGRSDRLELLRLLIAKGADLNQRGLNDWTPLHHAVSLRDGAAIAILLEAGADPKLRTRIDECSTALEDAEAAGFAEGAALLRVAIASR